MDLSKSDMIKLGQKQAQLFVKDNITYCEILVKGSARREILLSAYGQLVRAGKLSPIEKLQEKQKEDAWEVAKDIAKGRMGVKALIEVVKALLTIEYFLNLEIN